MVVGDDGEISFENFLVDDVKTELVLNGSSCIRSDSTGEMALSKLCEIFKIKGVVGDDEDDGDKGNGEEGDIHVEFVGCM